MTPLAVTPHAVMSVPDPQSAPMTYPGLMPSRDAVLLFGSGLVLVRFLERWL